MFPVSPSPVSGPKVRLKPTVNHITLSNARPKKICIKTETAFFCRKRPASNIPSAGIISSTKLDAIISQAVSPVFIGTGKMELGHNVELLIIFPRPVKDIDPTLGTRWHVKYFFRNNLQEDPFFTRHCKRIFINSQVFFCHFIDVLVCTISCLFYYMTLDCHHVVRIVSVNNRDRNPWIP